MEDDNQSKTDSTVIRPATDGPAPPSIKGDRVPVLVVLDGKEKSRQFPLRLNTTTVGRDSGADFVIDDTKASRIHSKILYSNLGHPGEIPDCRILDLDSTNGTFVNGEEVVDEDGVWLRDRDRVQIGNTVLGFFLLDEDAVPRV